MRFIYSVISFLLVIVFISGCSPKTEEEYFAQAKNYIEQEEYANAFNEFTELVNTYPDGKNACNALFEIGKLYHGKAVPGIAPDASFKKAVEFYLKSYEKCPENSDSPRALFMSGFIYANELKNLEDAEKTYKLFIEKYPENELVNSAQLEIQNLGIEPEEFLKDKVEEE